MCVIQETCVRSLESGQNMVLGEGNGQMTPIFLLQEPHELHEKAKRYDTWKWVPGQKVSDMLLGRGREIAPEEDWVKAEMSAPVLNLSGGSKVWCYKE